ncbi:hypothetical protein PSACC_02133 [Paramicrosporidium saccamoebae]|uniref:RRM domain-containing protein n=1 Tax=Paramicrosporidium saccamoebae TaxID=1246581 RepID=A0A2H9TJX5_9FUNG|nr:hypothetical protein PSACC_02133 [Paramicrosporidium saccamoebae]
MPLPKSKAFWAFASTVSISVVAVLYDRQRLKAVRSRYIEEATAMGLQPLLQAPRKVTLVSFANDNIEARKIRKLWRSYAVDLFTFAGCDYQLIECNAVALDKELDKRLPVPEGEAPPEEKTIAKLVTPDNWIRPMMLEWMQRINGKSALFPLPSDTTEATLLKMRQEMRPEPKSLTFFEDGIVALERNSYGSMIDGVRDFDSDVGTKSVPQLGYIPCDTVKSWRSSIYYVRLGLDPQVRSSSVERQLTFLKSKGLTEAEIDEAMKRAGSLISATGTPPPLPSGPPPSRAMAQAKFDWGKLFLVLAFIGSTGAALSQTILGAALEVSLQSVAQLRETQAALEVSLQSVAQIQKTQAVLEASLQNVSQIQKTQGTLETNLQNVSQKLTADIEGLKASQNYLYQDLVRELEDLREEAIATVPINVNDDQEKNLNERVTPKSLCSQLKKTFGVFGEILDVVAKRRVALRGQAFVLFRDMEAARQAIETLQGDRLYGKSMVIKYAKYKSDVISKADGTYEIERRRREQDRTQMAANPGMQGMSSLPMAGLPMHMGPGMGGFGMSGPGSGPSLGPQMVGGELQLPNKVLYLQNLPEGTTEKQLVEVFKKYPGFVEMRLVPNRPDVAFAEYESEAQAVVARQAAETHEIQPGVNLRVAFARR